MLPQNQKIYEQAFLKAVHRSSNLSTIPSSTQSRNLLEYDIHILLHIFKRGLQKLSPRQLQVTATKPYHITRIDISLWPFRAWTFPPFLHAQRIFQEIKNLKQNRTKRGNFTRIKNFFAKKHTHTHQSRRGKIINVQIFTTENIATLGSFFQCLKGTGLTSLSP